MVDRSAKWCRTSSIEGAHQSWGAEVVGQEGVAEEACQAAFGAAQLLVESFDAPGDGALRVKGEALDHGLVHALVLIEAVTEADVAPERAALAEVGLDIAPIPASYCGPWTVYGSRAAGYSASAGISLKLGSKSAVMSMRVAWERFQKPSYRLSSSS